MPWVLQFDQSNEPPEFQMGRWPDWDVRAKDSKKMAEISTIFQKGGALINPDLAPRTLELDHIPKTLPDLFKSCGGVKIISCRAKELIERVDTDTHQILPISLQTENDEHDSNSWYILNIFTEKTTIIREKSSVKPHFAYKDTWKVAYIDHQAPDRQMLLTPAALEGPHLWREAGYPGSMFMSDHLKKMFDQAEIDLHEIWHADIETMPIQHRIAKQAG